VADQFENAQRCVAIGAGKLCYLMS
jgi:hypothetical protein